MLFHACRGSDAHRPGLLVALLLYGYATGAFSSWVLERASYDSIAFRYIMEKHPSGSRHDLQFPHRFLKQNEAIVIQGATPRRWAC